VLEWYCRIKSRLEGNYKLIEGVVPKKGMILDIGCGYGFMAYMLHWTSKDRYVTGIDYDQEKTVLAQHNFSRNERIQFKTMDITDTFPDESYDCILLMDVLHYLTDANQDKLLHQIYNKLNPGGTFILRDGITDKKQRMKGTKLTEIFSTTIFGFNKTANDLHFISLHTIESFANKHQMEIEVVDETRYTSNVIIIMKKK
jgi:2-polyprenyl-3-methyl-5-hydroxy-6-metoxy-1,4-benzoquinol methylase